MSPRLAAICGVLGVLGNVVGVAVLGPIPSAYRPGPIVSWAQETMAAPTAATASGLAFALGLLGLAAWAIALGQRAAEPAARAAGAMIATGAVINAAGTLAPVVVGHHLPAACVPAEACLPAAVALLGLSLAFDALFNLLLGLGLVTIGVVQWVTPSVVPRSASALMVAAGAASLPVSLQLFSDSFARMLVVAGPLWLIVVAWTSIQLWRQGR